MTTTYDAPSELAALASPEAISAARDLAFEAMVEMCDLAVSYGRSAGEAAWRGDESTLRVHLLQLRLTVVAALQTYNEIVPEPELAAGIAA